MQCGETLDPAGGSQGTLDSGAPGGAGHQVQGQTEGERHDYQTGAPVSRMGHLQMLGLGGLL